MNRKVNQIILNAPKLKNDYKWQVEGYLLGRHVRKCTIPFDDWNELQFICKSAGMYHFMGNGSKVLICSIQMR